MQTTSQMMAAKKAAKRKTESERAAKQQIDTVGKDRNRIAKAQYKQLDFLYNMRKGKPCTEEEQLNDLIQNHLHYQTLVYQTDTTSLVVFEKLLRAYSVISKVYGDKDLSACIKAAQNALDRSRQPEAEAYSPNQRRALLRPLLELCNWAEAYGKIIPAATLSYIAGYCGSVQMTLYTTAFYSRPKGLVSGLFDILSGRTTFRELAKQSDLKASEFKTEILDTAWLLYRVVECVEKNLRPPESITDLKKPLWKKFSSHDEVQRVVRWATTKWLLPFEDKTGITLIDYKKFRADCVRIEKDFALG